MKKYTFNISIILLAIFAISASLVLIEYLIQNDALAQDQLIPQSTEEKRKPNEAIPLGSNSLDPNPIIEGFILMDHRGGHFDFELDNPINDTISMQSANKNGITFSGRFKSISDEISFLIKVYTNDQNSFINDEPIAAETVQTISTEYQIQQFESAVKSEFKEGIYYYIIENNDTDELIYAGRLWIKQEEEMYNL